MSENWIADRTLTFDSSGIRKVFDLGASLENPINLSIGQPHFDTPAKVQEACIEAIRNGKNGYSVTQGAPVLREKLQQRVDEEYDHSDRRVLVTSGTSGGLVLAMLSLVNPGDEVIVFDPYFVMYKSLIKMVGGVPLIVDTYPDFRLDLEYVADAIGPQTKCILLNSPSNPTGAVASEEEVRGLAELAERFNVALISDEIYRQFSYDGFSSPARYNEETIVIDGFSKSHAMTGWRVGYIHGPREVIETMTKLQQYTFVCAPHPAQYAAAAALDVSVQDHVDDYRQKRDRLIEGLSDLYEIERPGGAFYMFPRAPRTLKGTELVHQAIKENLLIIPGNIFSEHDSHFRISYAADDAVIDRGIEVLRELAG